MDLPKFKSFFNRFYDRMEALETKFHPSKLTITKYLARLKETARPERKNSISLGPSQPLPDHAQPSQPTHKPFLRSTSAAKPRQPSRALISIEEEDDDHRAPAHDRRSETAGGMRNTISHAQKEQFRPKTGQARGRHRYLESERASKTINQTNPAFCHTEESSASKQLSQTQYILDSREIRSKRKNFYLDLEKEKAKEGEGDFFTEREGQEFLRKSKGKANQRLWQKISRFL